PPSSRERQEIRSEALTFILIFRVRPRVEVLLVEGAHQFDVHRPECDMVELHCVHLSDSGLELSNSAPGSPHESLSDVCVERPRRANASLRSTPRKVRRV